MLRVLVCVLMTALTLAPSAYAGDILEYKETIGEEVSTFIVNVVEDSKEVIRFRASSTTGEQVVSVLDSRDGSNLSWSQTKGKRSVEARRTGNLLQVRTRDVGEIKLTEHNLDQAPWIQSREFGMRGFASNPDQESREFWIINPSDFSLNRMKAVKKETVRIKCGEQTHEAVRVVVSLAGWKSIFWSSEFWFRLADGLFLKYVGQKSGPNSPEVVSVLAREIRGLTAGAYDQSDLTALLQEEKPTKTR